MIMKYWWLMTNVINDDINENEIDDNVERRN